MKAAAYILLTALSLSAFAQEQKYNPFAPAANIPLGTEFTFNGKLLGEPICPGDPVTLYNDGKPEVALVNLGGYLVKGKKVCKVPPNERYCEVNLGQIDPNFPEVRKCAVDSIIPITGSILLFMFKDRKCPSLTCRIQWGMEYISPWSIMSFKNTLGSNVTYDEDGKDGDVAVKDGPRGHHKGFSSKNQNIVRKTKRSTRQ